MPKLVLPIIIIFLCNQLNAQTAGFTYQSSNGKFCAPVTIQFTNTSTATPAGNLWNLGNGQTSTEVNPAIVYATPGSYTVKLVAVYNNIAVETSQVIKITPGISITLNANRNYLCQPGPITFSVSGPLSITSYEWDFGDGSPPVIGSSPNITHNFGSYGNFAISVKAIDASSCEARASTNIRVEKLPISGAATPTTGCVPALVNFSTSVSIPAGSSVSNYAWDFNDGSPVTNTITSSTAHSYNMAGAYNPTVTVTTNEGCVNIFSFGTIAFGTPPANLIAYPDDSVYCGSEIPVFVAHADNADRYDWVFGDGDAQTVYDTFVLHKYQALGLHTVTVTPYYNGCPGPPASFQVNIVGVLASFTYNNTCINKTSFAFVNQSVGNITSYNWDFGDGSQMLHTRDVNHTFLLPGSFLTTLIVNDTVSHCSDTTATLIHSGGSTLTNTDTSICRNSNTLFSINNNQTSTTARYTWHVIGLNAVTGADKTLNAQATVLGLFNNNYVIIDNGPPYCPDTVRLAHSIIVRGPQLYFPDPQPICAHTHFATVNQSTAFFPADSVLVWYWKDGVNAANDTSYQPHGTVYPAPDTYNITLVARDNRGCIDSLVKPIVVNPTAFVQIIPGIDTLCLGQSDTLIAYHSDSLTWSSAMPLPCTHCDTLIVRPTANTQIIATASNSFGCNYADTAILKVYPPFTALANPSQVTICRQDTVTLRVNPAGKKISWTPAVGLSTASDYNPVASPGNSTTYRATLSDSAGCYTQMVDISVTVKSLPTVDAGLDKTLPYNSNFILSPLYSANARTYLWTPAGELTCTNCPRPGGVAIKEQLYKITVTSDSGCVAKDSLRILIECKYANLLLPSAFSPNNDSRNDLFYPVARGIRIIKKFIIYNRYGQKIFEAANMKPNERNAGWNGKFRGQDADMGTYVYFLEAICETGNIITKKDAFILIR